MMDLDTIAAVATAPGQAGIGVIRVSGPLARQIGERISGAAGNPRERHLRSFRGADGGLIDRGIVLSFVGPRSFTGEDVVEFQGHGGPVVLQMLLDATLALGARLARPGEFSERAFSNGRIDLAQAEAIADLIAGSSQAAVRGANRTLAGEFSARVHEIDAMLVALRIDVEAGIDFADEDLDEDLGLLADGQVGKRLVGISRLLATLRGESAQGVLLRDGITLALVGAPNVGKSSLLNRLAGESRAIVTPVPGTTRDLVRVELSLDGLPVEVVDTAGLRDTAEPVEIEGVRLAREQAQTADVVLWITDATSKVQQECLPPADPGTRRLGVINKIDLTDLPPGRDADGPVAIVRISALTGAGMDDLRLAIREAVGYQAHEGNFTARKRHLLGLDEAVAALDRAAQLRSADIELLAEELRLAHAALGGIVGQMTPDELLGEIFASFCIGK